MTVSMDGWSSAHNFFGLRTKIIEEWRPSRSKYLNSGTTRDDPSRHHQQSATAPVGRRCRVSSRSLSVQTYYYTDKISLYLSHLSDDSGVSPGS